MHRDIVLDWAKCNGITVAESRLDLLEAHQNFVLEVNKNMNLTAIIDETEFAVKHIIDSMTLLPYLSQGASLADIGSGAGFPGIVIKIMRDDLNVTLIESRQKKADFLKKAVDKLKIKAEVFNSRAEDLPSMGIEFDICVARAVAPLDKLIKYALPLVRPGGLFLAMKGPEISGELEKAKPALLKKGGVIEKIDTVEITDGLKRSIVAIRKNEED